MKKITLTQKWQELEQQVSVYWWTQVLDSKQTNKMTAQGQAQALTMLDTWTRARGRIPSNSHNAGPADQGPQVKRERAPCISAQVSVQRSSTGEPRLRL